jgi:hypothetical protein
MISPPSPGGRRAPDGRRIPSAALLTALLVGPLTGLLGSSRSEGKSPRDDREAAPGNQPRGPAQAADPLQPPVIQLQVNACAASDAPVELYARTGAGGWYGGALTTRTATCDPVPQGRCSFNDLAAGPWILRQGGATSDIWLEGGPQQPTATLDLPCVGACAVDLVVEANPACGDRGVVRLLPPAPLPASARHDPGPGVLWSAGQPARLDHLPCGKVVVELESPTCRQVHVLPEPDGTPLRAVRLPFQPLPQVTVRFVDHQSGAPIRGVTIEDIDGWTVHVSDKRGAVQVTQLPEKKAVKLILEAHHPAYQSTGVSPHNAKGGEAEVHMLRRQTLRVACTVDGAPCPGHTRLFASFDAGPPVDRSTFPVGGGITQGECTWDSPGRWRCERGRDFRVTVALDGRTAEFTAPEGAEQLDVALHTSVAQACVQASWPSADCVLELAHTVHPILEATAQVPLPPGEGPVPARVVCQTAATWAEVQLDRGGACTSPGPWAKMAGICARSTPGPAVEYLGGGGCMILDAASAMGEASPYASSSPPDLARCPSWFPPGDYFVACGEGIAQPVTLVAGEVLEWRPPAP